MAARRDSRRRHSRDSAAQAPEFTPICPGIIPVDESDVRFSDPSTSVSPLLDATAAAEKVNRDIKSAGDSVKSAGDAAAKKWSAFQTKVSNDLQSIKEGI